MEAAFSQDVIAMLGENLSTRLAPHFEITHDHSERIISLKINVDNLETRALVIDKINYESLSRLNFCYILIGRTHITIGKHF